MMSPLGGASCRVALVGDVLVTVGRLTSFHFIRFMSEESSDGTESFKINNAIFWQQVKCKYKQVCPVVSERGSRRCKSVTGNKIECRKNSGPL